MKMIVPVQSSPFSEAFGKQTKPLSMLSEEPVMTWFKAMRDFDSDLCRKLEHSILRDAAGQPLRAEHRSQTRVGMVGFAGVSDLMLRLEFVQRIERHQVHVLLTAGKISQRWRAGYGRGRRYFNIRADDDFSRGLEESGLGKLMLFTPRCHLTRKAEGEKAKQEKEGRNAGRTVPTLGCQRVQKDMTFTFH